MSRKSALEAAKNALWALGFAVGLWYFADQNVSEDKTIPVRLRVDAPSRYAVTYVDPPAGGSGVPEISVTLRGPKSVLKKLNETWEEARFRPKTEVKHNEEMIIRVADEFEFRWPSEVRVSEVSPETIRVRYAELETARAGVEIDIDETTIPAGYEIDRSVIPQSLLVRGPTEKLDPSLRLKTERVDVLAELNRQHNWRPGDRRHPPEIVIDDARVVAPDPSIVPEKRTVRVRIAFRAQPKKKDFVMKPELLLPIQEAFPFRLEPTTEAITVTLLGSDAAIQELSDPEVLRKRVRVVVRLLPSDFPELAKKVGLLVQFPFEVWTDEGIRSLTPGRELQFKVHEWTPPARSSSRSGLPE